MSWETATQSRPMEAMGREPLLRRFQMELTGFGSGDAPAVNHGGCKAMAVKWVPPFNSFPNNKSLHPFFGLYLYLRLYLYLMSSLCKATFLRILLPLSDFDR